ncbi:hypothetical protein CDD80_1547 [Ophiocordyceps camponoti-rufipedis]|uniref:Uncharacterized protein n=1 Tax=Ophiocordyceps camponoti-rufipedis TaxID=2004952 RepID=A0A2C5Y0J7_9HYPO|nr:hypothetical protein CDD80_1547 [Ophiocordyceps camponoti-rufipedis]
MTVPIRPELYALYGLSIGAAQAYYPTQAAVGAGYGTYPSSPVAAATAGTGPDYRRPLQRSTITTNTGVPASSSTLRSQSQPASRSPSAANPQAGAHQRGSQTPTGASFYAHTPTNAQGISFMSDDADFDEAPRATAVAAAALAAAMASSSSPEPEDGRSSGLSRLRASSPPTVTGRARPPHGPSNAIAFGDLAATSSTAPGRRRLSTDQLPQTILDRRMKRASRSPSPLGHSRTCSSAVLPASLGHVKTSASSRPLVVNGSGLRTSAVPGPQRTKTAAEAVRGGAGERIEERPSPASTVVGPDARSRANGGGAASTTVPQRVEAPPVVAKAMTAPMTVNGTCDDASFSERIAKMASHHISAEGFQQDGPNGGGAAPASTSSARLSPPGRSRWASRPSQSMAPLDLETGGDGRSGKGQATESAHLSPVYETTSPGAVRQRDGYWLTEQKKASRINGHVRGAKSESDGGWQKAGGKGRKKGSAVQGEQAPRDESERKGG